MQLLHNEAAVLSAEPEGVHQMRVAIRRMRAAISSLERMLPAEERRPMADELGWLSGALAPARNLDIFAAGLLSMARAALPDEPGWDDLAATLDRLRRAAYDHVREAILSERYTGAMLRLLRWFAACGQDEATTCPSSLIGKVAPQVLDRRRRKMWRRSKGFARQTSRQRHELRIAAKQLRYTIELCASLFDQDDLQKFVGRLKRLQDDLGYASDIRAAREFMTELFAEIDPRSPAAHAWAGLLEWHDRILVGGEPKLREHLRRLNRAGPFWRK